MLKKLKLYCHMSPLNRLISCDNMSHKCSNIFLYICILVHPMCLMSKGKSLHLSVSQFLLFEEIKKQINLKIINSCGTHCILCCIYLSPNDIIHLFLTNEEDPNLKKRDNFVFIFFII